MELILNQVRTGQTYFTNTLRWLAYFAITIFFLALLPFVLKVVLRLKFKKIWFSSRLWSIYSLKALGIEEDCINENGAPLSQDQQYIFISNHRSWLDHFVMQKIIPNPTHYVGKSDFRKHPIIAIGSYLLEYLPAKNNRLSSHHKTQLHSYLQKKESLAVFVEGTRGRGRQLLPFKSGAFKLAAKYNIPIVPIYLYGTEKKLSKENGLLSLKTGKVTAVIGQPISFSEGNLAQQIEDFEKKYQHKHNSQYAKYESNN